MGKGPYPNLSRRTHTSSKFWGHQMECLPCWPMESLVRFTDPHLPSDDDWRHSRTMVLTQLKEFTIIAFNYGPHALHVQLEMSCDQIFWDSYGELCTTVDPEKNHIFVPTYFFPYCRLRFTNAELGQNSALMVRFVGQT